MAETSCFEPSSLIRNIHKDVPFLTDASAKDAELVLNLGEDTNAFYDYFVVRIRYRHCGIICVTTVCIQGCIRRFNIPYVMQYCECDVHNDLL